MLPMTSGRRSRNTIITIVAAVLTGALVLAVWIVVMNTRPDTPTTLAGVKAEVMAVVDEIHDMVPAASVVDTLDESETVDCVRTGARKVRLRHVITVPADFDRRQWMLDLEETFRGREGWASDFEQLNQQADAQVRLVTPQTIIVSVVATADTGVPHVTILSTTRCTEPG
ncbi:hypothetical protein ASF62_09690 [Leifsonia sp. Leaf325]|nr:hypothetical protein ASF62_09690 [Leifsonia sp. Leaf325]